MTNHRDLFGGLWDFQKQAESTTLRSLVALDGDLPVGVLVHEPDGQGSTKVLTVIADGAAELALWQQLTRTDLLRTAKFGQHMAASPLETALRDPRVFKVIGGGDWLWLRILDVAKALTERGFDHDGEVTLHVSDPMGLTEGAWHVVVTDGRAVVEPADEVDATVRCGVDALAASWYGDTPVSQLAAAGRITGTPDAVRDFGRLMAVDEPPRNLVAF